jgi:hypothetical protein
MAEVANAWLRCPPLPANFTVERVAANFSGRENSCRTPDRGIVTPTVAGVPQRRRE